MKSASPELSGPSEILKSSANSNPFWGGQAAAPIDELKKTSHGLQAQSVPLSYLPVLPLGAISGLNASSTGKRFLGNEN